MLEKALVLEILLGIMLKNGVRDCVGNGNDAGNDAVGESFAGDEMMMKMIVMLLTVMTPADGWCVIVFPTS